MWIFAPRYMYCVHVAYCYKCRRSYIAWSVCLCVGHMGVSSKKTAKPIKMPFGGLTQIGTRNHVLRGFRFPTGRGNHGGLIRPVVKHWVSLQRCMQRKGNSVLNNSMTADSCAPNWSVSDCPPWKIHPPCDAAFCENFLTTCCLSLLFCCLPCRVNKLKCFCKLLHNRKYSFILQGNISTDVFPSVIWHCLVGDRKDIRPAIDLLVKLSQWLSI